MRKAETIRAREQANAAVREANDTYRDLATGATRYVHTLRKAQRAQAEAANVGIELDAEEAQYTAFGQLVAAVGLEEAQRVRDDLRYYPAWMRD